MSSEPLKQITMPTHRLVALIREYQDGASLNALSLEYGLIQSDLASLFTQLEVQRIPEQIRERNLKHFSALLSQESCVAEILKSTPEYFQQRENGDHTCSGVGVCFLHKCPTSYPVKEDKDGSNTRTNVCTPARDC